MSINKQPTRVRACVPSCELFNCWFGRSLCHTSCLFFVGNWPISKFSCVQKHRYKC